MDDFIENEYKKIHYKYPDENEFVKNDIQIIFLSWFWNNWSMVNNAKYSVTNGLSEKDEMVSKTGDLYGYSSIDDDWVSINQMIKYYKFGFGTVTDYLNFEIRSGNIKRKDAVDIVKKYDGLCSPKIIKKFCNYIEISENKFWDKINSIVNKKLFFFSNKRNQRYTPKFIIGEGLK